MSGLCRTEVSPSVYINWFHCAEMFDVEGSFERSSHYRIFSINKVLLFSCLKSKLFVPTVCH